MVKKQFLDFFISLSPIRKRVVKALLWYQKKFSHVFPSLETLAKWCGCNERTVRRAIRKLEEAGFLYVRHRGYQSNLYCLDDELRDLDLDGKALSLVAQEESPACVQKAEPESPACVHVLTNLTVNKDTNTVVAPAGVSSATVSAHKAHRDVPHFLKKMPMQEDQRQALANNFSDYELEEAGKIGFWYTKQGHKVKNIPGFLWTMAKKVRARMAPRPLTA